MAVALFLAWRLCDVQALKGPLYAKEALAQRSDTVEVFARRGSILDRYGNVLVRSLPSESVYAVPREIVDPAASDREIARHLRQARSVGRDGDARPAFVVRLDRAQGAARFGLSGSSLESARRRFKGRGDGARVDTAGRLASTVLGFVGTDENGLDGVEYAYDDVLRGHSGRVTLEADEFGRPIPFGRERIVSPAQPGSNVELTIDPYLQFAAEQALQEQVRTYHALDGTAIVMDPWTGEILALANAPNFDPNRFWIYGEDARRDRAVMDAYEPGSTFKLVTAAAALDSGKVGLTSRFPAHDTLEVGGRTIHNAEDGFMAGTGQQRDARANRRILA